GIAGSAGYSVAAFVEKPDAATAAKYVASGEYEWNSGMFAFTAGSYLRALQQHAPDIHDAALNCWQAMDSSKQPLEIPQALFEQCPGISIDYAVMEKAGNTA